MQDLAYLSVGNQKILVLRRKAKQGCTLKLRKSGKIGSELIDESIHLSEATEKLQKLLNGEVVYC
jgi:hypothetical protein